MHRIISLFSFNTKDYGCVPGVIFLFLALFLFLLALGNILFGVFYDTMHVSDTLFLLGAGWRAAQGLTPVLDFGYFYGGFIEEGLGLTMRVFGSDIFAFERFALLLLVGLILIALTVLYKRISFNGFMALVLILAVLMLTRYPLEKYQPTIDIISTHSFFYNRFGFALFLISGLFVALRPETERADVIPGALVGMLLVLAAVTKPTFIVLGLGVLSGLALQWRWQALVATLMGVVVFFAILDPTLQKLIGSFSYAQAQLVDEPSATIGMLFFKVVVVCLSQLVAMTLAAGVVVVLILTRTQFTSIMALVVVSGAGLGMVATMGTGSHVGQLALPLTILITLASGEIAGRSRLDFSSSLQMVSYGLVLAFVVPHILNLAGATWQGVASRDQLLIASGPYERYFSVTDSTEKEDGISQYEMLADGISALHSLGDPSVWGIIADHGVIFEHAVLGRPVVGYPLWQRPTAPELASEFPIAAGADIVMIGRSAPISEVGMILRGKLGSDFDLCSVSVHWEIYARITSGINCLGLQSDR